MTEIYTKNTTHVFVKELRKKNIRLDFDDELFYDFLKDHLDHLSYQPQEKSIQEIISYSKKLRQLAT